MKIPFFDGFSKLRQEEKTRSVAGLVEDKDAFLNDLQNHLHPDPETQKRYFEFSENTLSNYYLPFSIAPNFLINNRLYHVPMVIEESSVVAAAASAAKYWADKGGFHCEVSGTIKTGQVHFFWKGDECTLRNFFNRVKGDLLESLSELQDQMKKRGGGVRDIVLNYRPDVLPDLYQLDVRFETGNAMGANFINSGLEILASVWKEKMESDLAGLPHKSNCKIIMSILSNYSPECLVKCWVETKTSLLDRSFEGFRENDFSETFIQAVELARNDTQRAVTHNKGIFNGIDAVIIATGNDFRAVEANGHAYAARDGVYRGLSLAAREGKRFIFSLELPMMVGTVGGITNIHPMAKRSHQILGNPDSKELMQIVAAVGLANNFSAIRSLISDGIQTGHMKLHLSNILTRLNVTGQTKELVLNEFRNRKISYARVREYLQKIKNET
jgi:hydroxymethylglutaryl-CoA reductase